MPEGEVPDPGERSQLVIYQNYKLVVMNNYEQSCMIMLETERLVSANFNWSERVVKVLKMFQAKVSHNFIIFWMKSSNRIAGFYVIYECVLKKKKGYTNEEPAQRWRE